MLSTINGFDLLLVLIICALVYVISLQKHRVLHLKMQYNNEVLKLVNEVVSWEQWYEAYENQHCDCGCRNPL